MTDSSQRMGQDRRLLRKEIRRIDEEARNDNEMLASIPSGKLQDILRRTNDYYKQVEKPREHALDAGLFCKLTEAGHKAADKLAHHQQGRTVHDFIISLRYNRVKTHNPQEDGREIPEAFDWHKLSDDVAQFFKPAPGVSCMLGPMDVQAKVRKVAARQARRPTGEVVRPEELDQIQEQEKQETDRNMEEMWDILKQQVRCPVAELVCNHKCFAQTVENLFTLSFLVRDQRAYLCHEPEQGMMVQVVDARAAPQQQGKRADEQLQFVLSLTIDDWEVMKRVVGAKDTKMRHRDQSAVMSQNAGRRQRQQQQDHDQAGPSGHASQPRSKKPKGN